MKDIIKAIEAENQYIQSNNNDISLVELLKPYGYTNLNDYFYDKIKHQIINEDINIQYNTLETTISNLYMAFNAGISSAFSVKENYNRTWIWAGADNIYLNTEAAENLNYTIRNFHYFGGPIITSNSDFNLALILPNYIDLDIEILLLDIMAYFQSRNIVVENDNNDLLLNGKKILGSIVCKNDKVTLFAFSISLIDHTEDINILSLKESGKVPGFLNGITREELEEVFSKWLHTI